jgi:hypothetical protein
MKEYKGIEAKLHSILTSALDGGKWLTSSPSHFTARETAPVTTE